MKVKKIETTETVSEFEIATPAYLKNDDYNFFAMICEDGSIVKVTKGLVVKYPNDSLHHDKEIAQIFKEYKPCGEPEFMQAYQNTLSSINESVEVMPMVVQPLQKPSLVDGQTYEEMNDNVLRSRNI